MTISKLNSASLPLTTSTTPVAKNDATATVAAPSSNPFRAADVFVPHSENKLLINWDQLRDTPVAVPSKSLVKDESRLLIQWDPANGRKV
jgi:hypothetical protein